MSAIDNGGTKSARRVLELLEYLAEKPRGATFLQLTDALSLPKSSLHGLLVTLLDHGWIYLHEASRCYRIGVRVWQVAQTFSELNLLAKVALRHMESLRDHVNETVQLAVLEGTDNVYLAKVESAHALRLVSHVGARLPAYATGLGKVLLAGLDSAEVRRRMATVKMQPFTERTLGSLDALDQELDKIRQQGYGSDDGEYTLGVYCVAVPVLDGHGRTVAAMSCSVPVARFGGTDKERDALLHPLLKYAGQITVDLSAASEWAT